MQQTSYDVAIVGAGPTGLTLANVLGRAGLRILLIERNESTVRAPRAVSIDDESLRTMQAIGLADEVLRDVAADYGSHYFTAAGRCFARVEPSLREYGFPRRNAFTQPCLEQTLLDALKSYSNVTILFGTSVESLAESSGKVTFEIRTGDTQTHSLHADYLVGCDGAKSSIRKYIGADMVGSTYPQRWLIVDLARTAERLRQTRVVCDPDRPLITLPGPHGIRRYEFRLRDDEADTVATDSAFVRSLLARYGPDADAPIVRAQTYAFHALIANKWNTDRIFLAGDAAHLSPPFAGQGMNSGVRDAFNLGWKLSFVMRNQIGCALLRSYFSEREPHARDLIRLAVNMGRIMMPKTKLRAFFVQHAFLLARFAPRLQAYFSQMKYKPKPFYRSGFLDRSEESEIVGRMVPQPVVQLADGQLVLLDECLGKGFCLLAYGQDSQRRLEEAQALDFGIADLSRIAVLPSIYNPDPDASRDIEVVRDVHRTLHSLLPEDRTVVMLLRPDRYIAAATAGPLPPLATRIRNLVDSCNESVTGVTAISERNLS